MSWTDPENYSEPAKLRRIYSGQGAFNLRMPRAIKDQLREAAEQNGRSLNAEIIYRLRASLETYRKF